MSAAAAGIRNNLFLFLLGRFLHWFLRGFLNRLLSRLFLFGAVTFCHDYTSSLLLAPGQSTRGHPLFIALQQLRIPSFTQRIFPAGELLPFRAVTKPAAFCAGAEKNLRQFAPAQFKHTVGKRFYLPLRARTTAQLKKMQQLSTIHSHDYFGFRRLG